MEVKFTAEVKSIQSKKFVSGDVGTRIILDKDAMPADQLALLNAIFSSKPNKSQELTITIDSGDVENS